VWAILDRLQQFAAKSLETIDFAAILVNNGSA
jgi:hypothetical protein